jgi:hypothetical protein
MPSSAIDGRPGRLLGIIACGLLLASAAIGVLRAAQLRPYEQYSTQAQHVRLGLERFMVDSPDSRYPVSVAEAAAGDYLAQLPENPFAAGTLLPLAPGAPWQAGGFVYLPVAQRKNSTVWGVDGPQPVAYYRWLTPDAPPLRPDETVQHWALIFYAQRGKPYLERIVRTDFGGLAHTSACFGSGAARFEPMPPGIDWQHAAFMLTSIGGMGFR